MLDFFGYGEMLLDGITAVGDFLLTSTAPLSQAAIDQLSSWLMDLGWIDAANWLDSVYVPNLSYAGLLFGSGVIIFLIVRFIKFITDIVT